MVNLREEPGLVIGYSHTQSFQSTATLLIELTTGVSHTVDGDCALERGEAARGVWVVREYQHGEDGDEDSDCSFNDEKPPPSAETMHTIKTILNASTNETAKTTGQKTAGIEDRSAESKLLAGVPS